MGLDHLWDFFVNSLMVLSMPFLCCYHALCSDLFFNVAAQDAQGLEALGNVCFTPLRYLAAGKQAFPQENGSWVFIQEFDYNDHLFLKSTLSIVSLPLSIPLGILFKGSSFILSEGKERYESLCKAKIEKKIDSKLPYYQAIGICVESAENASFYSSESYQRRFGDENHLASSKEALLLIGNLLNQAKIPWWVDCGTLLGTHRYGGVIPWDEDVDISILLPDFENAKRALQALDPNEYTVQDWSGRDFPNTFLKVYIRKTGEFIDIDTYAIDEKKKELSCIFSLDKNIFFFEWWKIRERRFTASIGFDLLFPLKKSLFDGVEVFVPNQPVPFLQRYYGDNLAPAKIYDPLTNRFEKDLSHPYWQRAYVH